jgi:hypothetical protein
MAISLEGIIAFCVIFRWKKASIQQRLLIVFLISTFFVEVMELWMGFHHINNLWLEHIFTLGELILLLSVFYLWKIRRAEKRLIIGIGILFFLFWLICKVTIEPFDYDDTYSSAVAKIREIVFAAWVVFDFLNDSQTTLKDDARIWIASSVIIYAVGSLLLFTLFSLMVKIYPEMMNTIWSINWILMIVSCLLYARGIWCRAPNKFLK